MTVGRRGHNLEEHPCQRINAQRIYPGPEVEVGGAVAAVKGVELEQPLARLGARHLDRKAAPKRSGWTAKVTKKQGERGPRKP